MKTILSILVFALSLGTAQATQPECTGDRHYDGVGCCPVVTTTTTIPPQQCEECPPVACPDPAPCQPVTCECQDGDDGVCSTSVTCERQDASLYVICNGPHKKPRKGDVWINEYQGWYHCPGKGVPPHKILLPKFAGSYEQ